MEDFKIELLKLLAQYDCVGIGCYWNEDLDFFVMCNDWFFWGCADCEIVQSQQDVDDLRICFEDVMQVDPGQVYLALSLFAARKRKLRPQGAMYERLHPSMYGLFDAAGEVREINTLNPVKQPNL